MYMKIHEDQGRRIVAVCDRDLLGTVLEDRKACMDLDRYRSFYSGELVGKEQVLGALSAFDSLNFVGKTSVGILLEAGLAEKAGVLYIKKIPYIQVFRVGR